MMRPQRRVFGRDITNIQNANQKPFINNKVYKENNFGNNSDQQKNAKSQNVKKNELPTKNTLPLRQPIQHYTRDIIYYMLNRQRKFTQQINQKVTKSMRQILYDWLIDVHTSFGLKQQTLHLAFSYINQFQSKYKFQKEEYQLVGITCLWIASKYEEIYPPRMESYLDVTANTYTISQLKKMEQKILQKLQFNLNHITMLSLLQASLGSQKNMTQLEKKSEAFSKYILQNLIIQGGFLHLHNPSKLVCTHIYFGFKLYIQNQTLNQTFPRIQKVLKVIVV